MVYSCGDGVGDWRDLLGAAEVGRAPKAEGRRRSDGGLAMWVGEGSFRHFAHLVKDETRGEAAHESQGAGDTGEYFELVLLQTFYSNGNEFVGLHKHAGVHVAEEFIV